VYLRMRRDRLHVFDALTGAALLHSGDAG
jgi:hypothetical protein